MFRQNTQKERKNRPPPMASCSDWDRAFTPSFLPNDVLIRIASLLNVSELCSLGTCSRYLRETCASDSLWLSLFKCRWPSVDTTTITTTTAAAAQDRATSKVCAWDCIWVNLFKKRWPSVDLSLLDSIFTEELSPLVTADSPISYCLPPVQGWKKNYIRRHKKIADGVSTVICFVEQYTQNDSLEIGDYLRAVEDLASIELGFEDVKLFLFNVKNNVLLNLIGLHYSMFNLGVLADDVNKALHSCQVSAREISVFSYRLGRWFFGFRLPDERFSRKVSLSELTAPKEEMIHSMLNRGAVHEVLRVQITAVTSPALTVETLPDPCNIS